MKIQRFGQLAGITLAGSLALAACGSDNNPAGSGAEGTASGSAASVECAKGTLNAEGSSAQKNAIEEAIATFQDACEGATVNYNPTGSGAGIKQFLAGQVDFAGSDSALKKEEKDGKVETAEAEKFCGSPAWNLPMVTGPVAVSYNLPGVDKLILTPEVIADIFNGKITTWNDPAIAKVNPGVKLPDMDITVVHRSDGSGTSYIWVDYLSKVSPQWAKTVGVATSVKWPVGLGGKGNEGVAGLVKQTPGSIGYVELIYALQNKIAYGAVQNAAGEFVKASIPSVTAAAAAAVKSMPKDFRVSITNAPGAGVYPVSSFTWLLLYENPKDKAQGKVMVDFMKWALTDGQKFATDLGYAPLPPEIVKLELAALETIKTT